MVLIVELAPPAFAAACLHVVLLDDDDTTMEFDHRSVMFPGYFCCGQTSAGQRRVAACQDIGRFHRRGAGRVRGLWPALLPLALSLGAALPQNAAAQLAPARPQITSPIDSSQRIRLFGNTRPEATAANDRGRVAASLPMMHMQLLLRRPPEREQALQRFIDQLHNPGSPNYHRWLDAATVAQRFGPAAVDVAAITAWLQQNGFTVNVVYPSLTVIDFSGTAEQVRMAFRAEIHDLLVQGIHHIANMSDPQIPAALAPAVQGVVSLHDFRPHALQVPRAQYSTSGGLQLVVPADLATIYDLGPVFASGNTGQNQTIAVVEDTDLYSTADWSTFRSTFGLSGYSGTLSQVHPAPASGTNNCTDPNVVAGGADGEAILDAEWAGAAAPGATIAVASCQDSGTTFGGLIVLQNLINAATTPAIISLSYGECEVANGATANAAFSSIYEQAAAEGISVFVAAGDSGAAACDANAKFVTHGIGVNGFASTAYNVAVGGTDFGDSFAGTGASYWSASNSATYGSALSYVPEIPWNDSCTGELLAQFEGYAVGYGSSGFCNSSAGSSFLAPVAGGGGPSGCASGSPARRNVVGGSCTGVPKPSWQAGPGVAPDGVRDLPDVSLFAGNGVWGHYYVFCWSDLSAQGGAACTGAPSGWSGAGGTSFAAPILAGIQALVNTATGARQGNPNYVYYALAASQSASGANCNATNGSAIAASCVFQDVTQGDSAVACGSSNDCYRPSGTYGMLSTSSSAAAPAFPTAAGWDFASGVGSVNAQNLVSAWNAADLSLVASGSVTSGNLLSYTLSLGNSGPQTATAVTVSTLLPSGTALVTADSSSGCTQSGQMVTCIVGALAVDAIDTVVVVIQPGTAPTVNLNFTAQASNPDIDPGRSMYAISLNVPNNTPDDLAGADGPVPWWANAALALLLIGFATRRLGAPT
jgi:uncharacterized repeat protein (TIGR01451 family)